MRRAQENCKAWQQLQVASGALALVFLFGAMPVLAAETPTEAIKSTSTEVIQLLHDEELQSQAGMLNVSGCSKRW